MRPTDEERKVWLIWSGQYHAWWREDPKGYTQDAVSAGRYTASEVTAIKSGSGEEKMLTGMIAMGEHTAYAAQLEGEVERLNKVVEACGDENQLLEDEQDMLETDILQLRADKAELVEVLGYFLGEDHPKFQPMVGGNPHYVDKLLAKFRTIYAKHGAPS